MSDLINVLRQRVTPRVLAACDFGSTPGQLRRFWIDIAIICVALLGLAWIIPGQTTLATVWPYAGWILVLLLTMQHGTKGGLTAVCAGVALELMAGWPAHAPGQDFYAYLQKISREPLLWVVTAVVLGAMRDAQLMRAEQDAAALAEAGQQRVVLAEYCHSLRLHSENIGRQLAVIQERDVATALHALVRLKASTRAEAVEALPVVLGIMLGPLLAAVYVRKYEGIIRELQVETAPGVDKILAPAEIIGKTFNALFLQRRPLSVLRAGDADLLEGLGVCAVPIQDPRRGDVLGVLVLETVAIERLDAAMELALRLVANALFDPLFAGINVVPLTRGTSRDETTYAAIAMGSSPPDS